MGTGTSLKVDDRPCDAEPSWRSLVAELGGNPYHLPEVWRSGPSSAGVRCLSLVSGGRPVAACLATIEREFVLRRLPRGRSLHLPTAAASNGEAPRAAVYEALLAHARAGGYRHLSIDARWGEDFTGDPLFGDAVGEAIIEFGVDLGHGIEGVSRGMHKKHRKNVRAATDAGVTIECDDSLVGLLRLREMQTESAERGARRGNPFSVQDERAYRRLHADIYSQAIGHVLFARRQEVYLAGLAYLTFGRKAVTVRSGSTALGYELSAMYLLQFELFRILAEQGVAELNIGGVPAGAADPAHPSHGLYNYKRYYGGAPHLRTAVRLRL